jgi:hypothetical protein
MNSTTISSRAFWCGAYGAAALFAIKGIYVCIELIYNHSLMEFVGSRYLTESQIENLELFGRNLAATGLTILLLRPISRLSSRLARNRKRLPVGAVIIALAGLIYGSTYLAQRQLVEYLASSASVEARYDAYYLNMLRGVLARGDVINRDILPERQADEGLTPEDKLTLVVAPLAVSGDKALIASMRERGFVALNRYLRDNALHTRFDSDWNDYRSAQQQIADLWSAYQKGVTRAADELDSVGPLAAESYTTAIERIDSTYESYEKQSEWFRRQVSKRMSKDAMNTFRVRLAAYFSAKQANKPKAEIQALYLRATQPLFGFAPARSERWCDAFYENKLCPGSLERIEREARAIFDEAFRHHTNGLPRGLTRAQFIRHPAIGRIMADMAKPAGLVLPKNYKGTFPEYLAAFREKNRISLLEHLNSSLPETVGDLPFGLDVDAFVQHEAVRKALPDELRGYPLFLTMDDFFLKVWAPQAEKRIQDGLDGLLPGQIEKFDEGEWRENGIKAVKMLYVLPLAMSLSVVFSLLNIATMIGAVAAFTYTAIYRRAPMRGIMFVAIFALAMFLPYVVSDVTRPNHVGFEQILKHASEAGPPAAVSTQWLIQGEMTTYRLGAGIVSRMSPAAQRMLSDRFGGA